MRLRGLLSFPLTPFTNDGAAVNFEVFVDHLREQVAAGPSGLFVACGTGEFTALSLAEHRDIVTTAVETVARKIPVFAGTGGGPQIARDFARAATEAGADGLLLLPPYLVETTPAGLVRHVRFVAEATPLPIVVYQRANAVLNPAAAVELLDIPNVVGIKDGRGDVDAMLRLVTAVRTSGHPRAAEFGFLNGLPTAELSVKAYEAIGVESYSSAVLCFAPQIATRFYRAVREGDDEAMNALLTSFYLPLVALRDRVPGGAVSLVKAGAMLHGLHMGPVRPPLLTASEDDVVALAGIIFEGMTALEKLS
jgi:5-dehydro-4-deoxyglucarate dehydratase